MPQITLPIKPLVQLLLTICSVIQTNAELCGKHDNIPMKMLIHPYASDTYYITPLQEYPVKKKHSTFSQVSNTKYYNKVI